MIFTINNSNSIIETTVGDITLLDTDAIVNPANSHLILGGGVAGAVRNRGGASIQEECSRIGHTPVGTAVITGGGNLKASFVIHAVGPMMGEGDEDNKLTGAVQSSLNLAKDKGLKSIAFPAISTGIFGYPKDHCALIMTSVVAEFLSRPSSLKRVVFCLYDKPTCLLFEKAMWELLKQ